MMILACILGGGILRVDRVLNCMLDGRSIT